MVKKTIILFIFFTVSWTAQSQIIKNLDTLDVIKLIDKVFIDHDIDNYSLRFFSNYKVKQFRIKNEDDFKSKYSPNNKFGLGFGFASSKLLIDIAFNLKTNKKHITHRFDMQGTSIVGKKNYINFYVQTYKGFNVRNNFDEPFVFRDDIRSVTVGFNYLRTIPDIEFSYSMLKAGVDNLNRKVYITGGFGAFGFYDYFSADDNILEDPSNIYFNEQAHVKRYNSSALGILGGLMSVFRLPQNFTASCNIMPGVGLMYKHVTLEDNTYKPSNPMIYKMDYTFALGYNVPQYYVSLIYGGGVYSSDLDFDNTYSFNLTKAKIAFGYKLGTIKPKPTR
ncbi:conserved hypothetical protein (DUF4421) [Formosa agariphila KMM 3901]|uniref:DUF4421 domain-containing protein n=1 Tax=Formosa agariphila (strain DSM 15362 / KCTC 12365 / LMG 23005 / KMM 3901 / M-2Alg 35-1) TaxID=1347342 RepID=T2KML2_FORAG|nr:DUF4421 family protein [Formosa agariphila]CDF79671.1 conserved hypothetical protein (DUF4421) [Formosa agariphila KMM 3901]